MESKRDDLVKAAKSLLWDVGYEAMSPKKILTASNAGQGSLYHHFDGKMDLAAAALAEVEVEMCSDFDLAMAANMPPMDRLVNYLKRKRIGLKGCRLGRLANESAVSDPVLRKPLAKYFSHVEKGIAKTLAEAVAAGEVDAAIRPKEIANALVAVVQGGYVLSRVHNDSKHIRMATNGACVMLDALKIKRDVN